MSETPNGHDTDATNPAGSGPTVPPSPGPTGTRQPACCLPAMEQAGEAGRDAASTLRYPNATAKLVLGWRFGIRMDELWDAARRVADGQPAAGLDHVAPQIQAAVVALAREIKASRVPLVAIGPEGLEPDNANWIAPGEWLSRYPLTAAAGDPTSRVAWFGWGVLATALVRLAVYLVAGA